MKKSLIRISVAVGIIAFVGGASLLGGCSAPRNVPAKSTSAAPDSAPATPPAIELVAPAVDGEVPAGDVKMSVKTTGLKFVMASNTNIAGEGHVHFTLDDRPFKMSIAPDYVYEGVTPGEHRLVAELVQNDTKSFTPPVRQEIVFTTK